MHLFRYSSLICLSVSLSSIGFAERVERLTPPRIGESSIDQKIACTRPMRKGRFNISVERKDGKIIVNDVGHGGSGCTTVSGSVTLAIELFEKENGGKAKTPVRVLGNGIIGLTTAIELKERGYDVAGITTEGHYDIPSWKNAGYFALVSVETDPEEQERLNKIGMHTFLEYKKIHEGKHPYIDASSVRFLPVYCSADTESGIEDLERKGLIPPREAVTLDFGNGVTHPNFVKYMTYFMDTTRIMMQLRDKVKSLGINVEERGEKVASFSELSEEVIFNCAGLGAKELNNDDQMVAVRGHLLNLNDEAGSEHMDYMIYTKVKDGYVYMFPKALQVTGENPEGRHVKATLGGTFIPNTDKLSKEELANLDKQEFSKLVDRTNEFFWGSQETQRKADEL